MRITTSMELKNALLCLDCDTVYEAEGFKGAVGITSCPRCGSRTSHYIQKFLMENGGQYDKDKELEKRKNDKSLGCECGSSECSR
jgi:hypothetical protein